MSDGNAVRGIQDLLRTCQQHPLERVHLNWWFLFSIFSSPQKTCNTSLFWKTYGFCIVERYMYKKCYIETWAKKCFWQSTCCQIWSYGLWLHAKKHLFLHINSLQKIFFIISSKNREKLYLIIWKKIKMDHT